MVRGVSSVEDVDVVDISNKADKAPMRWIRGTQGWQAVLAAGLAVLVASTTTLVLRSSDPASADTFVAASYQAQVYLPDGTNHAPVEGERLPKGAELHTGKLGGAKLQTGGRAVYVGALTTLQVLDGVHQAMLGSQADGTGGSVFVDARRGAHLDLDTKAGRVRVADKALTRVEARPQFLRVAAYNGRSAVTPVGRSATTAVPGLHQVQVGYDALPGAVSPLALIKDAWDERLANDLNANDTDLSNFAIELAGTEGATVISFAPASLRTSATTAASRGQDALALLIAQASRTKRERTDVLAEVRSFFAAGGSWGVIAALENASVSDVSKLLNAALTPAFVAPDGTATNAGGPPEVLFPNPTLTPSVGPSGSPSSRPTTGTPPTKTPTTPTTPPTPDPPQGLVNGLITTITDLIVPPTQAPSSSKPAPTVAPVVPVPTPTCLLGLILCH
jgi:hypothetical protein